MRQVSDACFFLSLSIYRANCYMSTIRLTNRWKTIPPLSEEELMLSWVIRSIMLDEFSLVNTSVVIDVNNAKNNSGVFLAHLDSQKLKSAVKFIGIQGTIPVSIESTESCSGPFLFCTCQLNRWWKIGNWIREWWSWDNGLLSNRRNGNALWNRGWLRRVLRIVLWSWVRKRLLRLEWR